MLDLVIKGGRVLDGLGGEGRVYDVGIKDGKIAELGECLTAKEYIDAAGLTVTPGFIDSHSHSDNAFESSPDQREKVEQGITHSITGQCGSSSAPYLDKNSDRTVTASEYFEKISGIAQGSGASRLIGHRSLRLCAMGSENREPTEAELDKMKMLLSDGLDSGAIGLSFGLFYAPGSYAKLDELIALARVVKEHDGIIAAHIRNESDRLIEAVEEFLTVIRESGCRAVFSHHKAARAENHGKVRKSLKMIDEANAEGCDIYLDVYPYNASHTSLSASFVPSFMHPVGTKSVLSLIEDEKFCEKLKAWGYERWKNDLSFALLTLYPTSPEYIGKNINEIASIRGDKNPYDTALSLIREGNNRASACYFTMSEDDVRFVLAHPRAMICTDSSVSKGSQHFHPRLRASFPRALRYARELGVCSLSEMIRKMTSLPAKVYGLKSKGVIAVGMDADLCVFDAERITDKADCLKPTEKNEGLSFVIVNGKVAAVDGVFTEVRAAFVK